MDFYSKLLYLIKAFSDITETVTQLMMVICAMKINGNIPKPLHDFIIYGLIDYISAAKISYLSPQWIIQN